MVRSWIYFWIRTCSKRLNYTLLLFTNNLFLFYFQLLLFFIQFPKFFFYKLRFYINENIMDGSIDRRPWKKGRAYSASNNIQTQPPKLETLSLLFTYLRSSILFHALSTHSSIWIFTFQCINNLKSSLFEFQLVWWV